MPSRRNSLRLRAAVAPLVLDAKPETTPEAVLSVEVDRRIEAYENRPAGRSPFSDFVGEPETGDQRSFFASSGAERKHCEFAANVAGGDGLTVGSSSSDSRCDGQGSSLDTLAGGSERHGEGVGGEGIPGGVGDDEGGGGNAHTNVIASDRVVYECVTRMGAVARPPVSPLLPNRRRHLQVGDAAW